MIDQKGKPLTAGNGEAAQEEKRTPIIALDKAARKLEATLIAQFSIAGHLVHKGECGDYLVIRWGMSRFCKNIDELKAFAVQTGVAS